MIQQQVATSESGGMAVSCGCAEHKGKELINQTYNLSVERLLELMFTHTEINRKFWAFRKLDNVKMTEWTNNHKRLDYSNNLGPFGVALVTEELEMLRHEYNECVVIESESFTQNVMYCEYFTVINRFCITKQTADSSHVYINFYLKYRKQPNFISKVFIEKNTEKALKDCFIYLAHILKDEKQEEEANQQSQQQHISTTTPSSSESDESTLSPPPAAAAAAATTLNQTSQLEKCSPTTTTTNSVGYDERVDAPVPAELLPRRRQNITRQQRRPSSSSRTVDNSSFIREEVDTSSAGGLHHNHHQRQQNKTTTLLPPPVHQDTVVFLSWRVSQASFIKCLMFIIFLILFFNARIYMKLDRAERLVVNKLAYSSSSEQQLKNNKPHHESTRERQDDIRGEILLVRQLLTETFETLKKIEKTLGKWDSRLEENGGDDHKKSKSNDSGRSRSSHDNHHSHIE